MQKKRCEECAERARLLNLDAPPAGMHFDLCLTAYEEYGRDIGLAMNDAVWNAR